MRDRPITALARVTPLLLALAGCGPRGGAAVSLEASATAAPPLVWPLPPEPARIRHVAMLSRPIDIGARPTIVRRVLAFFTGSVEPSIRQPYGVAVDTTGRIFVADQASRGVHVFDPAGRRYQFWDRAQRTALAAPMGVAVDDAGGSYVTDSEQRMVVHWDASGREVWRVSSGLQRPTGVALDRARGWLYVVDTPAHQVLVFDTTGALLRTLGQRGAGPGEFNFPTNVALTPEGRVYITDSMNFRIQAFSPDGVFQLQFGQHGDAVADFIRAKGVAVDSEGHIYVVDGLSDVVKVFDARGRLLLTFGVAGHKRGEFWLATGIAIDRDDRIYVSDSFNNRVQVFAYLAEAR